MPATAEVLRLPLLILPLTSVATLGGDSVFAAEKKPLPTAHTTRNIEGWTVRVDDRLLKGDYPLHKQH